MIEKDTQYVPQTVFITPPAPLMADCPRPFFRGKTNGDLLHYSLDLSDRLDQCNHDKKLMRQYVKNAQQPTTGKAVPAR